MDRREAFERRAWRLAFLLTGRSETARRVVQASLDAQPDFTRLPPARVDRLVILASRRVSLKPRRRRRSLTEVLERVRSEHHTERGDSAQPGTPLIADEGGFTGDAAEAHRALLALPDQQRAAWILRELDGVDDIETSKAMDCSRTALSRHLERARESMRESLADRHDALIEALRSAADGLDPTPFVRARAEVRVRRLRVRLAVWLVVAAGLIAGGVALWMAIV